MAGYSYPDKPRTPFIQEPRPAACCAKCRRGIKGFGELPCGYSPGKCPNDCHGKGE